MTASLEYQQEPTGTERFFAFARARHEITLARRAGLPHPWTDDAILATYRFTNVFRELDRVTLWIDEHVRRPLDAMLERGEIEPWQVVLGIVLARTFNRTETLEMIFCQECMITGAIPGWDYITGDPGNSGKAYTLNDLHVYMLSKCSPPWVTGAYIVKTPDAMDKLAGALWIVERARERLPTLARDRSFACSMQALHADLVTLPYLGGFTAYEIVSDVRWTEVGRGWPDIMSWAHAGPGAIRGLHRVHGRDHTKGLPIAQSLAEMRDLLRMSVSWTGAVWEGEQPKDWPAWEMREVEHTLCEWDKYERARLGQGRPRGVYR